MKKALCVLLSVVMLLSMSVTAFAADTKGAPSQTLPSWLPDDAPAPDPNSEISIVHFYINEDGETIVYDPETEVIPYSTAYGDAGTAAIYWVRVSLLSFPVSVWHIDSLILCNNTRIFYSVLRLFFVRSAKICIHSLCVLKVKLGI